MLSDSNLQVEFVGSGFENQSPNSNPAVILISKKFGVVRIEKFPESQTDTVMNHWLLSSLISNKQSFILMFMK